MDTALLARIQFALTIGFHYLFPPLSIGLAWYVFWIMSRYRKTGDAFYKGVARFWIKLLALTFAVGVATGITMEFQFGTNWSEYSRYVGDIFGAPLAAEGIFAFFLESSFLAVLILGWKRVSTGVMWFASLMVALGSTLSAFWIIVANSWQQTPAGFRLAEGRAELTDFFAAVFNPSTVPRFLHAVDGALIQGAFFVMGVSALFILRGRHVEFAKESFKKALFLALGASLVQFGIGHWHAVQVAETQPEKLAAVEGIFETQKGAPALLFGIPDEEAGKVLCEVKIPGLLSLLAFGDADAEVKGLNDFPRNEWPPLAMTFFSFHLMVGLGAYFLAFALLCLFLLRKKKLFDSGFVMKLALFSIPLPFLSNELGWITAEVGRQPWAVYHRLKTREAVSVTVPAGNILFSIIVFALIYALLFFVWIHLLRREIGHGPEEAGDVGGMEVTV